MFYDVLWLSSVVLLNEIIFRKLLNFEVTYDSFDNNNININNFVSLYFQYFLSRYSKSF